MKLDFAHMKRQVHHLVTHHFGLNVEIPGLPALEWIESLCAELEARNGKNPQRFRSMALEMIVAMELEAARRGRLFPFTRPILRDLALLGVKIAIITRNCEKAVRCVFPDMEDYCSILLARDHVPRVKPDPDHLLRALDLLHSSPERSLMVGDHPLDVETGRRAGAMTAGVCSGRTTEQDLRASGAKWTAPDCRELLRILREGQWVKSPHENAGPA